MQMELLKEELQNIKNTDRRWILFGAGNYGNKALHYYGKEKIAFFCDNDISKQYTFKEGILIIPFEKMIELYEEGFHIMITPQNNIVLIGQVENAGVRDYLIFHREKDNPKKNEWTWDDVLNEYNKKSEELDLIQDVSKFKLYVSEIIAMTKEKGIPFFSGANREGLHYGNLAGLVEYGDISWNDSCFFPKVCHNELHPGFSDEFYNTATIMAGSYFRERIHKRIPYAPIFCVGPYIYYQKGIYDNSQIMNLKNKNGKTLLAFLPHSEEFIKRENIGVKFVDNILELYKNKYDTIYLCVFWIDINEEVVEYATKCGIKVVSAGFRFDSLFSKRLKSIIELTDDVVCADLGTFIPYSLFLNKPVAKIELKELKPLIELECKKDNTKNTELTEEYYSFMERFNILFDEKPKINEEMLDWIEPWAGFKEIKTKREIRCMFKISKEIEENMLRVNDYPTAVRMTYKSLDNRRDLEKMIILKKAVGNFLD